MDFAENTICIVCFIGIPALIAVAFYHMGYDEGQIAGATMTKSQSEAYLRDQYKNQLSVLESAGFVLRKRGE